MDIQLRLLVVDDDAAVRSSVAKIASAEGFDVCTAADAATAIEHCQSGYLDLVMIDTCLDGASGVDVLKRIRTLKPAIRAVLMHAGSGNPNAPDAFTSDALERFSKPLGLERLRRLLERLRSEPRHVLDGADEPANPAKTH